MRSVSVRELKEHLSRILRQMREEGEEIEITHRGQAIARLVPAAQAPATDGEVRALWCDLDRLIDEISDPWPEEVIFPEAAPEERQGT